MIDIKEIRQNPEKFKKAAKDKNFKVDIDRLLEIDSTLKTQKQKLQDLITEKKQLGKSIPKLADDQKQTALEQLSKLKQQEADYNEDVKKLQPEFDQLMQQIAQPADEDVPTGKDDTENVEIRKEGQIRKFDFEPKDHVQLGLAF